MLRTEGTMVIHTLSLITFIRLLDLWVSDTVVLNLRRKPEPNKCTMPPSGQNSLSGPYSFLRGCTRVEPGFVGPKACNIGRLSLRERIQNYECKTRYKVSVYKKFKKLY